MSKDPYFSPERRPTATLGCGTFVLIAVIVAIFSNSGHHGDVKRSQREIERKLDRIERENRDLTRQVEALTREIRALRETWTTDRLR